MQMSIPMMRKKVRIKAELEIQNLLQEGEEYLLLINLESGNDVI